MKTSRLGLAASVAGRCSFRAQQGRASEAEAARAANDPPGVAPLVRLSARGRRA